MESPREDRFGIRTLLVCVIAFAFAPSLHAGEPLFRRGDSNQDGNTDLSDGIFVITYLFLGGSIPGCLDSADVTDDSEINVADPVNLMNFLFRGGPQPPPPGPFFCGDDPTDDNLGCLRYSSCDGSCTSNADCPRNERCAKTVGDCDGDGVCQPRPAGCPRIFDPVCGCDGETYANACVAAAAGVNVLYEDECEARRCGTIAGIPCEDGELCEFPPGTCNIVDNGGVCVPVPDACPEIFDPVCGCDGRTYGNDCERQAERVQKAHDGECDDRPRCGGFAGVRCDEGEFCDLPAGTCDIADGTGVCVPVPDVCTRVLDPVCGCDGVTYGNDCRRQQAQVQKAHDGICDAESPCGGFAGIPCGEGEFCQHPPNTCNIADGTGVCVPVPVICTRIFDPVCGCDGQTYGNDCERRAAQVQLAQEGACPE